MHAAAGLCIINEGQILYPVYRLKGRGWLVLSLGTPTPSSSPPAISFFLAPLPSTRWEGQRAPHSASDLRNLAKQEAGGGRSESDANGENGWKSQRAIRDIAPRSSGGRARVRCGRGQRCRSQSKLQRPPPPPPLPDICSSLLSWTAPRGRRGQVVGLGGGAPGSRGVWDKHCRNASSARPIC